MYRLLHGDCREALAALADASIDAIVTDPPYGLSDHKPAEVLACLSAWIKGEPYKPMGKGFMGKAWDAWVPGPEVWRECLRVLKPGGHILVFAGTRSMDLMSMALRLAGFELRDSIGHAHEDGCGSPLLAWVYGSGFPKSLDVSKAIDKAAGAEREVVGRGKGRTVSAAQPNGGSTFSDDNYQWPGDFNITAPATEASRQWQGWGTALKPAWEPIILARKPLIGTVAANVQQHGTGALNIDGCRVATDDKLGGGAETATRTDQKGNEGWTRPWMSDESARDAHAARGRANVARAEGLGRWPANLVHDGSWGVLERFPVTASGAMKRDVDAYAGESATGFLRGRSGTGNKHGDAGSAARFFYCAKASKKDRNEGLDGFEEKLQANALFRPNHTEKALSGDSGKPHGRYTPRANNHPTVKPTELMAYLCRLVTPPGGTVLDPFMGSGSTGKACALEGFAFIGIERDAHYLDIARARIEHALAQGNGEQISTPGDSHEQGMEKARHAALAEVSQSSLFDAGKDAAA